MRTAEKKVKKAPISMGELTINSLQVLQDSLHHSLDNENQKEEHQNTK